MAPHQERVVTEKSELDMKIAKLTPFLDNEMFKTLPTDEQSRLSRQLSIMQNYSQVLGERIAAF